MSKSRLKYLLFKYAANKASMEEAEEMLHLIRSANNDAELRQFIADSMQDCGRDFSISENKWDELWNAVSPSSIVSKRRIVSPAWLKYAAVIALLVCSAAIILFIVKTPRPNRTVAKTISDNLKIDVPPGNSKAVLKLSNGRLVNLDTMQIGAVINEAGHQIIKQSKSILVYKLDSNISDGSSNITVSTPIAADYEIILPDQTKVWLNASSSLDFPSSFLNKRQVNLRGEAYFEVAHAYSKGSGKKIPFSVNADDINVEVMGTHFNINAYADEQEIKTTLLEGKIKITRNGLSKILSPGQQAITNHQESNIKVALADEKESIAWKDGFFRFRETSIKEIMDQVKRWYNVEVEYRTSTDGLDFTGIVPRTKNVSALLQTLELTGSVHFIIEKADHAGSAGKIIVMP